jgi:copper chaperone CopZ
MKQITLKSADIHCDACATSIKNTVGKLNGVESVDVKVPEQTTTITFDEPATEAQVRETMTDAGFDIDEGA